MLVIVPPSETKSPPPGERWPVELEPPHGRDQAWTLTLVAVH